MELSDVFLEVILSFIMNPLFEIVEIKCIWVTYLPIAQPFNKEREVITDFFTIKDTVYHVTTEES